MDVSVFGIWVSPLASSANKSLHLYSDLVFFSLSIPIPFGCHVFHLFISFLIVRLSLFTRSSYEVPSSLKLKKKVNHPGFKALDCDFRF